MPKTMRLATIVTVWADVIDILPYCLDNLSKFSDEVIVIWSVSSNYFEINSIILHFASHYKKDNVIFIQWEPYPNRIPSNNETAKRNYGLQIAEERGHTHFLIADGDELYNSDKVLELKDNFPDVKGLVCKSQVFFKSPTLTIGEDVTLVPFIHQINYFNPVRCISNRNYPFAWVNGQIRIDPTRQMNITSGVEMCDVMMYHYSWVRKDYKRKIENSTARNNIQRSTILKDLELAKEGYFCQFYNKTLERSTVDFGIPEM